MPSISEILKATLNEIKEVLKEILQETETKVKQRLKKLLITSIITTVLLAVAISFLGSASLFLLVGSLKYLKMFVPPWLAWIIMGIMGIIIAVVLLIALFLIVRKQVSTPKTVENQEIAKKNPAEPVIQPALDSSPVA